MRLNAITNVQFQRKDVHCYKDISTVHFEYKIRYKRLIGGYPMKFETCHGNATLSKDGLRIFALYLTHGNSITLPFSFEGTLSLRELDKAIRKIMREEIIKQSRQ